MSGRVNHVVPGGIRYVYGYDGKAKYYLSDDGFIFSLNAVPVGYLDIDDGENVYSLDGRHLYTVDEQGVFYNADGAKLFLDEDDVAKDANMERLTEFQWAIVDDYSKPVPAKRWVDYLHRVLVLLKGIDKPDDLTVARACERAQAEYR
jgi:hypothetical protein